MGMEGMVVGVGGGVMLWVVGVGVGGDGGGGGGGPAMYVCVYCMYPAMHVFV